LIQSQDLSSSSDNTGASSGGDTESSNAEFGDGQEAIVVGDGANNHNSALIVIAGFVRNNSGNRDWGSVDTGHEKSAEHDFVEGGSGSACGGSVRIRIASRYVNAYEPKICTASQGALGLKFDNVSVVNRPVECRFPTVCEWVILSYLLLRSIPSTKTDHYRGKMNKKTHKHCRSWAPCGA
jgi:hypothetical protein